MERIQIELAPRDSKNLALLAAEAHKISQNFAEMVRLLSLDEPESDISGEKRVTYEDLDRGGGFCNPQLDDSGRF